MLSSIQLFKEIGTDQLRNSYLFIGDEEYLKEEGLKKLNSRLILDTSQNLDRTVFYGDSVTGDQVLSSLLSVPMLASKRIVTVRDAQRMDPKGKKIILEYLKNPVPSSCLILVAHGVNLKQGYWRDLSKITKVYDFRRLSRFETGRLILSYVKKYDMSITDEARELLIENVGGDTLRLLSELEKLISFKSGTSRIDRDDVERVVGFGKLQSIFKLQDSLGKGRTNEALATVEDLLLWNEKPTRILASLGGFYLTMLRLKRQPQETSPGESAARFGLSSFYLKKCSAHLSRFSEEDLLSALSLTSQKELQIKEGASCVRPLLSTYITQLCTI